MHIDAMQLKIDQIFRHARQGVSPLTQLAELEAQITESYKNGTTKVLPVSMMSADDLVD